MTRPCLHCGNPLPEDSDIRRKYHPECSKIVSLEQIKISGKIHYQENHYKKRVNGYFGAVQREVCGKIDPYSNLAMAVVAQAVQDTKKGDSDAKDWLLDTGRDWTEIMGLEVTGLLERL